MIKWLFLNSWIFLVFLTSPTGINSLYSEARIFDEIYYFVNDEIISKLDFEEQKDLFEKSRVDIGNQNPNVFVMSNLIFNRLIFDTLALEEKQATKEDVDKEIKRIMQQQGMSSLLVFQNALARSGIDYDIFYANLARNLNQRIYFSTLPVGLPPSEGEIEEYLKNNQAKFIIQDPILDLSVIKINLFDSVGFSGRRKFQQQLQAIRAKIENEKIPFEQAVEQFNDLKNNVETRRLGLVEVGDLGLSPTDKNQLLELRRGDLSEIISTPEGLNIFLVHNKVTKGRLPFHLAKTKALQELIKERREREISEKISQLFRSAYLKNNNPLFNSLSKFIDYKG